MPGDCGDELVVDFEWPSEEQVIKMSSGDFAAIIVGVRND